MERIRRKRWSGSVYQRSSDGLWVTVVSYPSARGEPRRRKMLYSGTKDEAQAKLDDLLSREPQQTTKPRHLQLIEARDLGRHRPSDWAEVLTSARGFCMYCRAQVGLENLTKDHRIPISRGGSDSLENLAPACMPCNSSKKDLTDVEFIAHLARLALEAQV